MDANLSFGEWLRRRRRGLGLTQVELGQRIGYSGETLRKVEADELRPSRALTDALAQALDLAPDERAAFVHFARGEDRDGAVPLPTQTATLAPSPLARGPHPLPTPPTPLVGRDEEIAALGALLIDPAVRLVTLTGAGGSGKTRLALAAAAHVQPHFPDSVAFVDLAPLRDAALVASAVASSLGLRETADRPYLAALQDALRDKTCLLVLDNFEHLLAAAPLVADLLTAAPHLKALVTSREVLRLRGEHVVDVEPLPVPPLDPLPPPDRLSDYPAIALFCQRAADASPAFRLTAANAEAVAQVCARLDGLPLAIELAAARARALPPTTLLAHLDHRLALLTGGARDLPTRQQTLRAELDWSYDLLTEAEQALFRRLAVFVGGFTLDAAEAIDAIGDWRLEIAESTGSISNLQSLISLLESLVAKSLLTQREAATGQARFGMLETIREYAWERLEASGEAEATRQAHAVSCLRLAEEAEPHLASREHLHWLNRLEREQANIRAALETALKRRDAELALSLVGSLAVFWQVRGDIGEGLRWTQAALKLDGEQAGDSMSRRRMRARALHCAGRLMSLQTEADRAAHYLEQSAALYREVGDSHGLAWALGALSGVLDDPTRAETLARESLALFEALSEPAGKVYALTTLSWLALARGERDLAETLVGRSISLARHIGALWALGEGVRVAFLVSRDRENYSQMRLIAEEYLALVREIGDRGQAIIALFFLSIAVEGEANYMRAEKLGQEALDLARELGSRSWCYLSWNRLGETARCQGDYRRATECYRQALALSEAGSEGATDQTIALLNLGFARLRDGDEKEATARFTEAMHLARADGASPNVALALIGFAGIAAAEHRADRATRLLGKGKTILDEMGAHFQRADHAEYDAILASIHAQGEATFALAWAEGVAMTVEEAIAYALAEGS